MIKSVTGRGSGGEVAWGKGGEGCDTEQGNKSELYG